MVDEIALIDSDKPLTVQQVKAQVRTIQELMSSVMISGQHYGTIPGCGDKPALFKAGAEKICFLFRICPEMEIDDLSTEDEIRYRVKTRMLSSRGNFLGMGVGEASSNEEKYKWRRAVSEEEWEDTPDDRRRIKYIRDGAINQVRTNPADQANTILKMSKKRSVNDGVLTVTAASDIFSQADDLPSDEESQGKTVRQPSAKSKKAKDSKKDSGMYQWTGRVKNVIFDKSKGKTRGKDWTLHIIECFNEMRFAAFSKTHAEVAEAARIQETKVMIEYSKDSRGNTAENVEIVE